MAPSKRITDNERYARFYFTTTGEENQEKFRCGAVNSQITGKSYSNLMAHIKIFHKNYEREAKDNQGTLKNIEISPVVMNIYGWIDWICCEFYTVENDLDRRYSKLNHISYKKFMKYLELVTRKMEERVANENPDKFALVSWWRKLCRGNFGKKKSKKEESGYMNCKFLLPTSSLAERFFSLSGIALNEHRQSLASEHLEEQLFLKVNQRFWRICLLSITRLLFPLKAINGFSIFNNAINGFFLFSI